MIARVLAWGLAAVIALPCLAGQPTGPGMHNPDAPGGESDMLIKVLEQLKNSKNLHQTNEGLGPIPARRAKLCDICTQPLYRHAEPNFECVPLDENGVPRKVAKITSRPVQCPVCNAQFTGALRGNINDHAGRDRDFCPHSLGKFTVHSNVWLCPDCGYAALIDSFGKGLDGQPIPEEAHAFVKEKLSERFRKRMIDIAGIAPKKNEPIPEELLRFSKYVMQTEIPDYLKYDHALQIYERIKLPHTLMATLYLDAAHACTREICAEVAASGLDQSLQESLGGAIRRINAYLLLECLDIRRKRGDAMMDPNKPELDPGILSQAAVNLIRKSELAAAQVNQNPTPPNGARNDDKFFTAGDMYVLFIRYAGVLDRLGRGEEAGKALSKARGYIPASQATGLEDAANKASYEYYERQLKLLRNIIDDRQECLKRERQYLFSAANRNMAALKFKELKLKAPGEVVPPEDEKKYSDPAPTSYLLGEMLRRCNELPAAAAWFSAASGIIGKHLEILDAAERDKKLPIKKIDDERNRWLTLKTWTDEQRALVNAGKNFSGKPADEHVRGVVDIVLRACGLASGYVAPAPTPATADSGTGAAVQAAPGPDGTAKVEPAAPKAGSARTREELLKLYYAALLRYRKEKNANPARLIDLVNANFISPEDSNLDEKGKLICPETKEGLGYARNWQPGESSPVIFPIKPGTKSLFADGEIRAGVAGK